MSDHIIVWDIETIPDLKGFAAANSLHDKTDPKIREAMGDKFPKHIYHSIVCIGALIARREIRVLGNRSPWRSPCQNRQR